MPNYYSHLFLWALNGFIQGMGWPPCGRTIGHWFSVKERGTIFGVWNIAHNFGGGIAGMIAAYSVQTFGGWQYAFYVPGIIAAIMSVYLFCRLRDTPQSVGLPSIEEYTGDFTDEEIKTHDHHEKELTFKELFVDNILLNKYLWLFAFANFFVYIARYSMLDWGPKYLAEVKGAKIMQGGFAVMLLEFGGIPSTILVGWFSDKFGGRRGMVSLLCMIPIVIAFSVLIFNPVGNINLDLFLLVIIGFFVYPPVMLLGVAGLDMTSKKAVGTAAGFIGLFGYLGRTTLDVGIGSMLKYYKATADVATAWHIVLITVLVCSVISIVLLAFTWNIKPKA